MHTFLPWSNKGSFINYLGVIITLESLSLIADDISIERGKVNQPTKIPSAFKPSFINIPRNFKTLSGTQDSPSISPNDVTNK